MDSNGGLVASPARVVGASRIGSEHRRVARNNQDAWVARVSAARAVVVVADGCSMGAASEVGAHLLAAWVAEWAVSDGRSWSTEVGAVARVGALQGALDEALAALLGALGGGAEQASRYLLASVLCGVVEGDQATVFGCGDGLWAVGSNAAAIDPGPLNAPPYLAYRALSAEVLDPLAPLSALVVHHSGRLAPGERLYVATDGALPIAAELAEWLAEPALWSSPRALSRRLNVHERRLADDTTIAALWRAEEVSSCG